MNVCISYVYRAERVLQPNETFTVKISGNGLPLLLRT